MKKKIKLEFTSRLLKLVLDTSWTQLHHWLEKKNKQTKYNKARTEKVSKVSLWLTSKGQLVKEQKQIKTKKGLLQGIYLSDSSSVSSLESTSFLLRE